jgi:hypothetical protein
LRVVMTCMECSLEQGEAVVVRAFLRDDGTYNYTCERVHKSRILIQEPHHEMLFELGVRAILDGYFREAITAFSACVERFQELAIRAILQKYGMSTTDASSNSKKMYHSERQLGGFWFLWLATFKAPPWVIKQEYVTIRNQVVHGGRIPDRTEAVRFGDMVRGVILNNAPILKQHLGSDFFEIYHADHTEISQKLAARGTTVASMAYVTLLGQARTRDKNAGFKDLETYPTWVEHSNFR